MEEKRTGPKETLLYDGMKLKLWGLYPHDSFMYINENKKHVKIVLYSLNGKDCEISYTNVTCVQFRYDMYWYFDIHAQSALPLLHNWMIGDNALHYVWIDTIGDEVYIRLYRCGSVYNINELMKMTLSPTEIINLDTEETFICNNYRIIPANDTMESYRAVTDWYSLNEAAYESSHYNWVALLR